MTKEQAWKEHIEKCAYVQEYKSGKQSSKMLLDHGFETGWDAAMKEAKKVTYCKCRERMRKIKIIGIIVVLGVTYHD